MAERYTTDGTAILDSGFHIGDFISPQHAQSIAAALNAPPAAAVPPREDLLEAIGRGWTHATTKHMPADVTLAVAIEKEVRAMLAAERSECKATPCAVPEGYALVPVEPTEAMILAAREHHEGDHYLPVSLWRAMLAAANKESNNERP